MAIVVELLFSTNEVIVLSNYHEVSRGYRTERMAYELTVNTTKFIGELNWNIYLNPVILRSVKEEELT